jgi:hypothetical protein
MTTCFELVKQNVEDLTEKELDEILDQLKQRQYRLVQEGYTTDVAASMAGLQLADTLRAAAAIEKRNAAINLRIRTEAIDYLQTTWADDPTEGVLALLYGSPKSRFGSRASVNAAQDANFRRYISGAQNELEQAGLFDVLRRGELDRDVARAMWSVEDEAALARLPAQAVETAKILRKWQEVSRIEANRHGAWVGHEPNYIVRQSHHPDRIADAGETAWRADILPRLDLARMFPEGPPKDMDAWLRETYHNITTGVRPSPDFSARMAAFKGPGSLAKKMSQERVIHFKSADDWVDYNARFGFSNLREAYVQGLHRAAESTGLMQVLGTNPESNLNAIVQATRERLSRADPEALKVFDKAARPTTMKQSRIERAYAEVSGATRQAVSQRLAAVGAGIRVWNTVTGLGGAVVSAVTDIPVRASALRFQGQSFLGALGEGLVAPIRRLVAGVGDAERQATLAGAGYFNEIALGNLAARFSPDDSIPGRLNRATNTFFKWNLLAGWTDEMRRASLESMARFFGEVGDDYVALSDRTRQTLDRFRINETEWGVMRRAVSELDNGERFLTPENIRRLEPAAFASVASARTRAVKADFANRQTTRGLESALERVLEDAREATASKLQQLYADELNAAVISPDARTLSTIRQGQQAGTPIGEALRLFWQFKSFGLAIFQRGLMREFHGYDKGRGGRFGMSNVRGLSVLMTSSLAFGYMAMSLKDMIRGKKPRPLDNPKTWAAAMAQGGGAGIYGDFLFGEASRMGGGFLSTLGGPTVGKADEMFRLWNSVKAGDDIGAQALRTAISNTPYNNLFYTRMAADYLFLYEVQEAMNPGYLRRMERRVEQQTGQEWWLRPSEVAQ